MKVLIVTKSQHDNPKRESIVNLALELIHQAGHETLLAYQEVTRRGLIDAQDFMPVVRQHIRKSALMVVLYEPELSDGLIEMGIAYAYETPIWLIYHLSDRLPSSALGCAKQVIPYTCAEDLSAQLTLTLNTLRPKP